MARSLRHPGDLRSGEWVGDCPMMAPPGPPERVVIAPLATDGGMMAGSCIAADERLPQLPPERCWSRSQAAQISASIAPLGATA